MNSNFTMADCYEVLDWIPRSKVDRQEPVNISEISVSGTDVVLPTIYKEFDGIG